MPASDPLTPRTVALHEAVELAWRVRRHSMVWMFCVMALSIVAAIAFTPKYPSNAVLLLMLGPEYTVRATADEPNSSTNAMDADHIAASEAAILASGDLHRRVMKEVGLEEIYPDYAHPGPIAIWLNAAKLWIAGLFADAGASDGEIDPVDWALIEFDAHLSIVASRQGNVITATFSHPSPATARKVLTALLRDYLEFRRTLYSNEQSAVLEEQAGSARRRLEAARQQLADFRVQSGVADYAARLAILQHEEGAAEQDASDALSQTAQTQARVAVLTEQLARLPPLIPGGIDTEMDQRLTPLRTTLDALRAKTAEARANFRADSPFVQLLEDQLRQRERELAAGRGDHGASATHAVLNTVYQTAQSDLIKARADLAAAQARVAADRQTLFGLGGQIQRLEVNRRILEGLERERDVLDDNYRATMRLLDARHNSEQVDARRLPSVRVAQTPDFPLKPKPTRLIILLLGVFVSGAGAVGIPMLINLCRKSRLLRASVELELALPVLACIPTAPDGIGQLGRAAHGAR